MSGRRGGGPHLVAAAVWRARPEVIVALDDHFGEPVDAYVNGSQVWLRDDGPGGITLEWRLHPVADYRRPDGIGTYEVFSAVALALGTGADPPAALEDLWDGLEVFAAYGEDVEPMPLASAASRCLGIEPDAFGLVDHGPVGDEWERTGGKVSVIEDLLRQLNH
ncbi:MAG TPA: hypothetical protein VFJ79_05295 [Acidimicrobiales bacterium]|nr:hypothetical protein [Acidimicrobiales bacterium]